MITFASAVEVGDFVQIRDHKAHDRFRLMWWKVTAVECNTMDRLALVNRHGQKAQYSASRIKVNKWTPGEDNRDRI